MASIMTHFRSSRVKESLGYGQLETNKAFLNTTYLISSFKFYDSPCGGNDRIVSHSLLKTPSTVCFDSIPSDNPKTQGGGAPCVADSEFRAKHIGSQLPLSH